MRTFKDIVEAIRRDSGLDFERTDTLISESDVKRYINMGLRELAKRLVKLREDYFLTYTDITVRNREEIPLPADILINKIRRVSYLYHGCYYSISEADLERFIDESGEYNTSSTVPRSYYIVQTPGGERGILESKMFLLPSRQVNDVESLRIFYLRTLRQLVDNDDEPDIPGCQDYLYYYTKWLVSVNDPTKSTTTDMNYKACLLYTSPSPRDS